MKLKKGTIIPDGRLSMKGKLTLSLLSIAAILLISCIISVMEYDRMSNYVTGLIAADISSINDANKLSGMVNDYNLQILSRIGDNIYGTNPDFDYDLFTEKCRGIPRSEQLMYSFSAYMLTSLEFENVMQSDFVDTRSWFFERLQPRYLALKKDIDDVIEAIHNDLEDNSETFERGFYRSIIPGIVAVGVGLLLVIMLLFFVIGLYVDPLYDMLKSLNAYRTNDKKYSVTFDGDDQLRELNDAITDITEENQQLRKRILSLRSKMQ
ncbi:MAG: hypothetical protein KBS67_05975 [Bacteroidales bacterium]|nr:hypothetical protein [Candidatus Cryptobacteroides equifaecalis]